MRDRVAAEERLRQALAVALHECLPDTADDRMHPTGEDADEPFCEYLSHALIARITEPTWLAQNDLPDAAAQADTAPAGTAPGELEALDWAITSLDNVRSVYPPGAEYWADDQRQKMNALRSLRAALAAPSRDAGLDDRMLRWVAEQPLGFGDWACVECRPGSDMLVEGFRCMVHEARHRLASLDDAADGAPFPAGVNRADSEGER